MAAEHGTGPLWQDFRSARVRPDRFIIWPLWIPVGVALVATTAISLEPFSAAIVLVLAAPAVGAWLIVVLGTAVLAAGERARRSFTSLVAILLCAVPAMCAGASIPLLLAPTEALPSTAIETAAARGDSGPPIRFDWPPRALIPSYDRTLVYDPSGEMASQVGSRRVPGESAEGILVIVWHHSGHFYVVETHY